LKSRFDREGDRVTDDLIDPTGSFGQTADKEFEGGFVLV
jgi:hypothetical protein